MADDESWLYGDESTAEGEGGTPDVKPIIPKEETGTPEVETGTPPTAEETAPAAVENLEESNPEEENGIKMEEGEVAQGEEEEVAPEDDPDMDEDEEDDSDDDGFRITIDQNKIEEAKSSYNNGGVGSNVPGGGTPFGLKASRTPHAEKKGKFSVEEMDQIGNINGVPAHELDIESLEEKPWKKPEMDAKEEFTKLLQSHIESLRPINQKIYCLTQEMYDKALEAVQLKKGVKCPEGARFKFWVLKHFKIHERGSKKVLYCRKSSLPVVPKDKIYYAIERCHIRVGHSGRDKTWEEIKTNYAWIRYDIIHLYLRTCRVCSNKVPLKKQPLILMEFMTRVQMDLIDMTSRPDKSYKWILHMQDTFSQFSWTHPLPSKHHPETLANKLLETFCMFGSPQILQIYNGKEFLDGLIKQLAEKWSGIQILDGGTSPQGCCIKGANDDMELKLGKWLEGNPGRGWAQGLQFVTYSMNTFKSSTTNTSPYEVVFGQLPHGKYLER